MYLTFCAFLSHQFKTHCIQWRCITDWLILRGKLIVDAFVPRNRCDFHLLDYIYYFQDPILSSNYFRIIRNINIKNNRGLARKNYMFRRSMNSYENCRNLLKIPLVLCNNYKYFGLEICLFTLMKISVLPPTPWITETILLVMNILWYF